MDKSYEEYLDEARNKLDIELKECEDQYNNAKNVSDKIKYAEDILLKNRQIRALYR